MSLDLCLKQLSYTLKFFIGCSIGLYTFALVRHFPVRHFPVLQIPVTRCDIRGICDNRPPTLLLTVVRLSGGRGALFRVPVWGRLFRGALVPWESLSYFRRKQIITRVRAGTPGAYGSTLLSSTLIPIQLLRLCLTLF